VRVRTVVRYTVACAAVVLLAAVCAWAGYYSGEGL
jgi:hypothetical protein